MSHWIEVIVTIICAILASNGLWAVVQKMMDKKDVKTQMLIGLGHDRVMALGMEYLERGWITPDELENLVDYLYKPYKQMGGNGSAQRIVERVEKLPVHRPDVVPHREDFNN